MRKLPTVSPTMPPGVSGTSLSPRVSDPDYLQPGSIFDVLEKHSALNAAYNSRERESQHASTCQEGTREAVVSKILAWVESDDRPICWLEGPAGSGKSTVAHTIAERCDSQQRLAVSFFFSRGRQDRGDSAKFFATFAYQLASFLPVVQEPMLLTLAKKPFIPSSRLQDQIKLLIVDPLLSIREPISSMVVVIDGLDECDNDVQELIRLLADITHRLPFRFLFVSRPEHHIKSIFKSASVHRKTLHLTLRDFSARDDVRQYLRLHLSNIREEMEEVMQNVPRPWPTAKDLEVLVDQSEGLFIYVSTLVKFVADGNGLPQQKLQKVMQVHKGVDPLYDQILCKAQECCHFEEVMGAVMFLRQPLTIHGLEELLHLESGGVRLALQKCQSIFVIPNDDNAGSPQPYHASLRDFLTNSDRAKEHLLESGKCHTALLVNCIKLIEAQLEKDEKGCIGLDYACQNWCYHLSLALSHEEAHDYIKSCLGDSMEIFVLKIWKKWLKLWMYKLEGFDCIRSTSKDCHAALERIPVCLFVIR